jgi:hypothetical protein
LLKNLFSLVEPFGPPSELAPLSEMTMISVLSSSPIPSWSVCSRKPATTRSLLLTAGQARGMGLRLVAEMHPLQKLARSLVGLRLPSSEHPNLWQRDIPLHSHMRKQIERLKDYSCRTAQL